MNLKSTPPTTRVTAPSMPGVYLAGPDVFHEAADARFCTLERLCLARGLRGVRPSDGEMARPAGRTRAQIARDIYTANVQKLETAAGVLANLEPFRNPMEPDSGTVFEVGFAIAKGIPVVGLIPNGSLHESRIVEHCGVAPGPEDAGRFDARYRRLIEEFGLPLNLMLACSVPLFLSPDEALDHLRQQIG